MGQSTIPLGEPLQEGSFETIWALGFGVSPINWSVTMRHTYREANQYADWLANEAFNYELGVRFCDAPPIEVVSVVLGDLCGAAFPYLCNLSFLGSSFLSKKKKKCVVQVTKTLNFNWK